MAYKKPTGWLIIDLETLSKWDSAAILTSGLCYFSDKELTQGFLDGQQELDFQQFVDRAVEWKYDVRDQMRFGRTTDARTLKWWSEQDPELVKATCTASPDDEPIHGFFGHISAYLQSHGADISGVRLTDRTGFDLTKIQHLYEETLQNPGKVPWNYKENMDVAMLFKIFAADRYAGVDPTTFGHGFQYHSAKSDAALDGYRMFKVFAGSSSF